MYLVTLGIFEPMLCILFRETIYACTGLYWARGIPICTERSSDSHRIGSENEPKILDTKNALNGFKILNNVTSENKIRSSENESSFHPFCFFFSCPARGSSWSGGRDLQSPGGRWWVNICQVSPRCWRLKSPGIDFGIVWVYIYIYIYTHNIY